MAGDPFGARSSLGPGLPDYYSLEALIRRQSLSADLDLMPMTVKVLLENVLRHCGDGMVREADVRALGSWRPGAPETAKQDSQHEIVDWDVPASEAPASDAPGGDGASADRADAEIPFLPGRVIMQDFTGVPAIVDLAAMRDAMALLGGDPARVNPLVPADLVIDHSVQVDRYGTPDAFAYNVARE